MTAAVRPTIPSKSYDSVQIESDRAANSLPSPASGRGEARLLQRCGGGSPRQFTWSVYLGAGSLDDRRPFRQLGLDESGGFLRPAARRRIDADLLQALEHRRIV